MAKQLWAGRFEKALSAATNDFNSSIRVDSAMYEADIAASLVHARMLGAQGIIPAADAEQICAGLAGILADLQSGALAIDPEAEDIHMFVESELTARIGDAGKRLHTARSRNDQVATDTRLHLAGRIDALLAGIKDLCGVLLDQAERHAADIMPGYTHLQRAQPIMAGQQLLAYVSMLFRDAERLQECKKRTLVSPLGSCALAGTTYPIDRTMTAEALGFLAVGTNSIDCVSDRDFVVELCADVALLQMHLSRLAEEVILWCSGEFKFLELDDAFATGSSIMPQKKNPDIAELVRGKTGRCYGNLMAVLTVMKGLPLAYNKDMQEDKELVFDSVDTALACLSIFARMWETARLLPANMARAAEKGFINATDCADYLTKKGLPFRAAYQATGELVAYCIRADKTLGELSLAEYRQFSPLFEEDVYAAVDMRICAETRTSEGGAGSASVRAQLKVCRAKLAEL